MSQNQTSFFDSKGLVAVFLVGLFFIFWQSHLAKKYKTNSAPAQIASPKQGENPADTSLSQDSTVKKPSVETGAPPIIETTLPYDSKTLSFEVSNFGMGVKGTTLKTYTDREGRPVKIGEAKPGGLLPFETRLVGEDKPLIFTISKLSDNAFVGRARVNGVEIVKSMKVIPEDYKIETQVSVEGLPAEFKGISTAISDRIQTIEKSSMFQPQYDKQEFYFSAAGETHRTDISHKDPDTNKLVNVDSASINSHYFSMILLDRSRIKPTLFSSLDRPNKVAEVVLTYKPVTPGEVFKVDQVAFIGPKGLDFIKKVDPSLVTVINFGWFSAIARPILRLLQFIYSLISNWGLSIIFLTLIVRLIILPLHVMSYKSMEGMKRIQPMLAELREKYKNEPQRLNQEMLMIMKTHRVNPVGGCLPMLLQFPVFLALYQVLGQSIELYQAPFVFWIHDLSVKDPYYVLPVMMAVAMFFQMRITPSTLDPTQQKVMMFMPILFGFFTLGLPSGLTLYIFVSSLFGIGQQLYFTRRNKTQIA